MASQSAGPIQEDPIFQELARFRGILFDHLLKSSQITMSQGWVLINLQREDGLKQADLAERLDVATVTTSKLLDKLEARGYVERATDSSDRRSNRIYLTPAGRERIAAMTETIRQVDEITNRGVSPYDLTATRNVLGQMRENLKAAIAEM